MCSGVSESSQFRQCLNHFIYHSNQTDIYDLITNNKKESKTMAEVRQCTQKKETIQFCRFDLLIWAKGTHTDQFRK